MSDAQLLVMTTLTLAALFLVGSFSLVAAEPTREEHSGRVSYNEKAQPKPVTKTEGWTELATPTPATHGREYIVVDGAAGVFTKLRIVASTGRPIVRSVRVDFRDGGHRTVQIDEVLDHARRPSASVDLRGAHEIESIVVVTDQDSRGSYQVLGTSEEPVAHR